MTNYRNKMTASNVYLHYSDILLHKWSITMIMTKRWKLSLLIHDKGGFWHPDLDVVSSHTVHFDVEELRKLREVL